MKSLVVVVVFALGLSGQVYSQDEKIGNDKATKPIELPEVVIKSAGKDFSIYLPDKNPDQNVRALEEKFVSYDLGKDYEGYENYLVTMETKNGSLSATYNENGKLLSVVENYKNVRLPSAVIYSIYKSFPGWKIVNDKFLYSQEDGDISKKQYNLKIKRNKEVRNLVVNPQGDILKGLD
jgi:hypothetical protein